MKNSLLTLLIVVMYAVMQPVQASSTEETDTPVRIAIAAGGYGFNSVGDFKHTREILVKHFGRKRMVIYDQLRAPDLLKLIRENRVDYFISTSGIARRFIPHGSKELLAVATPLFPDPNRSYGTVFLVRDDSPIRTMQDMKGKRFVTNQPYGPYSYLIGMAELEKHGFNQNRFFSSKTFLMKSPQDVIEALMSGQYDVASVASCTLEDLYPPASPERTQLRPINLLGADPCWRSTEQFPNWTFSSVAGADPALTREIVVTLLTMPASPNGSWWGMATDFVDMDDVFRILQIGVYDVLKERSFKDFVTKYWPYAALLLSLVVLGFATATILRRMVQARTLDLQKALEKQIRLVQETKLAQERYQKLERVGLIGQLSTMFAHEIRQPIGAIAAYVNGLLNFNDTNMLSREMMVVTLKKIAVQASRAESIVERVQGYAKSDRNQMRACDIGQIVNEAIELFCSTGRFKGRIHREISSGVISQVDPLELQIALLNLLKNASDALTDKAPEKAVIKVTFVVSNHEANISVIDNGKMLTDEELRRMQAPLTSNKPHGLGIGLVLVRSIALRLGGRLELKAAATRGLIAVLAFPIISGDSLR